MRFRSSNSRNSRAGTDSRLRAEIPHRLQLRVKDVPAIRRPLNGREGGLARQMALGEPHLELMRVGLGRDVAPDHEAVVTQITLHDELALFELRSIHDVTRRSLGGSPYGGHGLEILRLDGTQKRLHGTARTCGAGKLTGTGSGCAATTGGQRERDENNKTELHSCHSLVNRYGEPVRT